MGPPQSPTCSNNLTEIKDICSMLGIPLALKKVEGPSDGFTFLGITLDSQSMQACLPDDKLQRIRLQVASWLSRKKAMKREILSSVGLLQHATKVVTPGRIFLSRMYRTAARLKRQSYYTCLNMAFRSDLRWWHFFVSSWNGRSFFNCSLPDHEILTDASGSWGCGAVFGTQWMQLVRCNEWSRMDIMTKELVPIVLSCAIWRPLLSGYRVEFKCDNRSVVDSINKGSSKEPIAMHLLRCLWFFSAHFDIRVVASHIPGVENIAADQLSRNKSMEFLQANPHASRIPVPIPTPLLKLVSPRKQNWTSPSFLRHFK
ncbi:uncharacterized protein [Dysidea avara]|uniref:uncharacterized protein n=1 Tax=Dysidea avara TaxID=196820 RepID=UPI0033165AF5